MSWSKGGTAFDIGGYLFNHENGLRLHECSLQVNLLVGGFGNACLLDWYYPLIKYILFMDSSIIIDSPYLNFVQESNISDQLELMTAKFEVQNRM